MSDQEKLRFCVAVAFAVAALLIIIVYGQHWQA
jgi:hypothetical protein